MNNIQNNNFLQRVCLAYAYVVPQITGETYEPETALENGTMFPELNIPFGCYVPHEETGGKIND